MWRNSVQTIIAMTELKDNGGLPNSKMHWIYEVFPEEINKKARQEVDDGNEDYATGCNVESDDGDDFYDIIF